ncbi:MAG TPA: hypothetical protein VF316_16580, partial [Polyangiaceae bacterium]
MEGQGGKGRGYTPEENAKLRVLARELVDRFGTQTALAEKIDVRQSTISSLLAGRGTVGHYVGRQMCALAGTTPDEYLGRNLDPTEKADPRPNRALAIRHLRALGISEEVLAQLRADGYEDQPAFWWAERAFRLERERRDVAAASLAPVRPAMRRARPA